jgi:hypothetical protein
MNCPVCFDETATEVVTPGDLPGADCPRCGRFKYDAAAWDALRRVPAEKRALVCGWIWEQNYFGSVPTVTGANLGSLLSIGPLPFMERAKRLLVYLSEHSDRYGKFFDLATKRLDSMLQTLTHDDVWFVAKFLVQEGLLETDADTRWRVTGEGFLKADEWKESVAPSLQGFVAMWIHPDMEDAWANGLYRAVHDAGYKPLRIDMKEHANKICDEIISEIRRSRFVVADYTGHRGGVYYEAGYAAGRGLPVFLSCRKDEMEKLHFDIRQYNCIDWENPDELARRLKVRIEALAGDGPLKSR